MKLLKIASLVTTGFCRAVGAGLFGSLLMNEDICEPAPTIHVVNPVVTP